MLNYRRATMRLLDRYLCREVASHAILGLAVFTFVFFVPNLVHLMDLVVRHSGGLSTVLLLFLCTLPPVLGFTIPMGVLVGVLIGLGRLSAASEIVALHADKTSHRNREAEHRRNFIDYVLAEPDRHPNDCRARDAASFVAGTVQRAA